MVLWHKRVRGAQRGINPDCPNHANEHLAQSRHPNKSVQEQLVACACWWWMCSPHAESSYVGVALSAPELLKYSRFISLL